MNIRKTASSPAFIVSLLFMAGFLLRILQSAETGHVVGVDGYYHIRIAEDFMKGDFSNFLRYPPGIHVSSAMLSFLTGSNEISLCLLSALFSSLAIIGVFLLARERFGSTAALFAALFMAISSHAIAYGSIVKNLNFSIAIMAFGLWLNSRDSIIPLALVTAVLALFSPLDAAALSAIMLISSFAGNEEAGIKRRKASVSIALLAFSLLFGSLYINESFRTLYISKQIPASLSGMLFYIPDASDFFMRMSPLMLAFAAAGIACSARKKEGFELMVPVAVLALAFPMGLLETDRWYVYFTLFLSVFAGYGLSVLWDFSKKSEKLIPAFSVVLVSIIASSMFLAGLALESNSWGLMKNERYGQFKWIEENTPEDSVILGTISESHWIFGIARRNPVTTANLIEDPEFSSHVNDIERIYITQDWDERKSLMEKYNVSYIIISDKTWWMFGDVRENFAGSAFEKVYESGPYIVIKYDS